MLLKTVRILGLSLIIYDFSNLFMGHSKILNWYSYIQRVHYLIRKCWLHHILSYWIKHLLEQYGRAYLFLKLKMNCVIRSRVVNTDNIKYLLLFTFNWKRSVTIFTLKKCHAFNDVNALIKWDLYIHKGVILNDIVFTFHRGHFFSVDTIRQRSGLVRSSRKWKVGCSNPSQT